jgi:hypothetical protein
MQASSNETQKIFTQKAAKFWNGKFRRSIIWRGVSDAGAIRVNRIISLLQNETCLSVAPRPLISAPFLYDKPN